MISKKAIILLVAIIAVIVSGVFLGPRITGYSVLEEEKMLLEAQNEEYEIKIESHENNYTELFNSFKLTNNSLARCEESVDKTYTQVEEYMNKSLECKMELSDIKDECEAEKDSLLENLEECETDLNVKYHEYNELVKSAGNKLCCIMKVYNGNINSFDIVDYEVKCREGNEGDNKIFL